MSWRQGKKTAGWLDPSLGGGVSSPPHLKKDAGEDEGGGRVPREGGAVHPGGGGGVHPPAGRGARARRRGGDSLMLE